MAKLEVPLSVDRAQLDWLQSMSEKYALPSSDKALRILILFAKKEKDPANTIFKEINIPSSEDEIKGYHALDKVHQDYLDEVAERFKLPNKDKAVQVILKYCIDNVDEKTLFVVKYCKHGDSCAHCK